MQNLDVIFESQCMQIQNQHPVFLHGLPQIRFPPLTQLPSLMGTALFFSRALF